MWSIQAFFFFWLNSCIFNTKIVNIRYMIYSMTNYNFVLCNAVNSTSSSTAKFHWFGICSLTLNYCVFAVVSPVTRVWTVIGQLLRTACLYMNPCNTCFWDAAWVETFYNHVYSVCVSFHQCMYTLFRWQLSVQKLFKDDSILYLLLDWEYVTDCEK